MLRVVLAANVIMLHTPYSGKHVIASNPSRTILNKYYGCVSQYDFDNNRIFFMRKRSNLNANNDVPIEARGLNYGSSLYLIPCY